MSLIAGISALALSAKMKLAIAGISAKIIAGAHMYKTLRQDNGSGKKRTTEEIPKDG